MSYIFLCLQEPLTSTLSLSYVLFCQQQEQLSSLFFMFTGAIDHYSYVHRSNYHHCSYVHRSNYHYCNFCINNYNYSYVPRSNYYHYSYVPRSKAGKRKTKVKKHTLNPVFEEILRVYMGFFWKYIFASVDCDRLRNTF